MRIWPFAKEAVAPVSTLVFRWSTRSSTVVAAATVKVRPLLQRGAVLVIAGDGDRARLRRPPTARPPPDAAG